MPRSSSVALAAALTTAVPISVAAAQGTTPAATLTPSVRPIIAGHTSVTAQMRAAGVAHGRLVRRHARVERAVARLEGHRAPRTRHATWTDTHLRRDIRMLQRKLKRLRAEARAEAARTSSSTASTAGASSSYSSPSAPSGTLQSIANCESGGNPSAVGGGGTFRGKYQFTYQTWAAVGGTGDPAAASEAEQDQRAAQLYAQAGAGQWPVCGR